MAKNYKVKSDLVIDIKQFQDSMKEAKVTIADFSKEFKTNVKKAQDDFKGFNEELVKVKPNIEKINKSIRTMSLAFATGFAGATVALEQFNQELNRLQAATGASTKEMEQLSNSMKAIYGGNVGQSLTHVGDAMAYVKQITQQTGEELEYMTKQALILEDTFGKPVQETMQAIDQLMKQFGIGANDAFNLYVQGVQSGLDKRGELSDSIAEYSVHLKTLGYDAEQMFNVMIEGSQNGAWSIDFLLDGLKEMVIRSKDASKSTIEAYEALGLNADKMMNMFANGGDQAQEALSQVFKALGDLDSNLQRNLISVPLFGAKFEDLEADVYLSLANVQDHVSMTSGALDELNEVRYDSLIDQFQQLSRKAYVASIEGFVSVIDKTGLLAPLVTALALSVLGLNKNIKATIMENTRLVASQKILQSSTITLTNAFKGLKTFLSTTFLPLAAIFAATFAIEKLIGSISKYRTEQKKLKAEQDNINELYRENSEQIKSLALQYEILTEKVNNGEMSKDAQEYLDVQNKLNEIFPILTREVDERGQAHLRSVDVVKQELEYAQKLKKSYDEMTIAKFESDLKDRAKEVKNLQKEIVKLNRPIKHPRINFTETQLQEKTILNNRKMLETERELSLILSNSSDFIREKANAYLAVSGASQNLTDDQKQLLQMFIDEKVALVDIADEGFKYEEFLNNTTHAVTDLGETLTSLPANIADIFSIEDIQGLDEEQVNVLREMNTALIKGETDFSNWQYSLTNAFSSVTIASQVIDHMTNLMHANTDAVDENILSHEELMKQYETATNEIKALNSIVQELNENHMLSDEALKIIMSDYPQLLQFIGDETALQEQLKIVINEKSQVAQNALHEELEANETFINESLRGHETWINELVEMYGIDLTQFATLAEKKAAIEDKLINSIAKKWSDYYDVETQQFNDRAAMLFETDPKMAMRMWDDIKKYEGVVNRFRDIVLSPVKVDFSSIGLNIPKSTKSSTPKTSTERVTEEREIDLYISDNTAKELDRLDTLLAESNGRLQQLTSTSADYRIELQKQTDIEREKQQLIHEESEKLKLKEIELQSQVQALGDVSKLTNDQKEVYNALAQELDETTSSINSLSNAWWNAESKIYSSTWDKVTSSIEEQQAVTSGLNFEMEKLQKTMHLHEKDSVEYQKLLYQQIDLYKKKQHETQKEIELLKVLNATESLTIAQKKELTDQMNDLSLAYLDYSNNILTLESEITSMADYENEERLRNANGLADEIIDTYKQVYEQQKDIALDTIDDELDELEKAHKKKIDMYDEELNAYESMINEKLKLIDRQADDEDYEDTLQQLQNEKLELQDRIKNLALDNSFEGQAKRIELEEELSETILDIESLQNDRVRELRKRSLSDQLEDYQEEIEEKKEAEDEKYDTEKERLERIRQETEYHYNELMNDERYFANVREQILNDNVDNVKDKLAEFLEDFSGMNEETIKELGGSWQEFLNLIDKVKDAQDSVSNRSSSSSSNDNHHDYTQDIPNIEDDDYAEIRRIAREHDVDLVIAEDMHETNQRLGYKKYHDGGWVGDAPLNLEPDKIPAILKQGEFVLSDVMVHGISDFSNRLSEFEFNKNNSSKSDQPGDKYEIIINQQYEVKQHQKFDRKMAEQYAKYTIKEFSKGMEKRGLK
ncbi:phage tail tape measure protein [Bacillus sp. SM2101]|uniref:phage tail tape measure protein n=1 Tax=Bacillus sp. SM2101 TaxID=2805366 RepID=UPI001BDDFFFB|nr:phage tail tape measure protein [Bacillus sp. SM2101]